MFGQTYVKVKLAQSLKVHSHFVHFCAVFFSNPVDGHALTFGIGPVEYLDGLKEKPGSGGIEEFVFKVDREAFIGSEVISDFFQDHLIRHPEFWSERPPFDDQQALVFQKVDA